jgi:anti-anti-sigma regulatory factor
MSHDIDHRDEARPSVKVQHGLGSARTEVTVIHALGEHDYAARSILASTVEEFEGHVLVDLTSCTFLHSSVIGALLSKARALGKKGYRLELVVPKSAPFARKVERMRLATLLPVHAAMPPTETA